MPKKFPPEFKLFWRQRMGLPVQGRGGWIRQCVGDRLYEFDRSADRQCGSSKYAGGNTDAFVLKLLPESFSPLYSTYWGGSGDEFGYGIYSEEWGGVWVREHVVHYIPIREGIPIYLWRRPVRRFPYAITLTAPDYFAIIRDLLGGRCAELAAAQRDYENKNTLSAIADLERLELEIGPQNSDQISAAALGAMEILKEER